MKIIKRIAPVLLAICLLVPNFPTVVSAADGVIFFSDLETKVGDTFTVTGTVVARNDVIGDATVEMAYDTEYIRFVEGDGVNADSEGKLTYTGSGDGSNDRIEFTMTFQALKEGSTKVEQDSSTVTNSNGETVECDEGYADITIEEGDPSKILPVGKTAAVTVDGAEYTLSEAFTDNELPSGFVTGEITYNGETYKAAVQEKSGLYAGYLIDAEQVGKFWLYNVDDSTFYPFEEIIISDTYSIIVLDGTEEVELPSKYTTTSISINETEFPAWIEPDRDGFFVMYAVNNEGEKSLYLYDSLEHTYQRMEMPKTASTPATTKKSNSLWDKIEGVITDYLIWVLVGVGCLLVILIITLITVAVKLRHRNLELDDLYDEYGIDLDDNESAAQPKKKNQFKTTKQDDDFDDDDYYDDDVYEDDDDYYDDDVYEDDDDLAELREDFKSESSKSRNYDEYYDDDDFDEDTMEIESPGKTAKEDTFEMDFIDLD